MEEGKANLDSLVKMEEKQGTPAADDDKQKMEEKARSFTASGKKRRRPDDDVMTIAPRGNIMRRRNFSCYLYACLV